MEISDVRKRVQATIDRARRTGAERQARANEASREYEAFVDRVAVPIFKQVAQALRAAGYPFTVFTPGGSVRLMSDRSPQDFVELLLDTDEDPPRVAGHASRTRGSRVIETEHPMHGGSPVGELTEEDVLAFLLKELEPFVER